MEINEERINDIMVISLKGRFDDSTAGSLEKALNALVSQKANKVLVDCRELEYISSAGLRVLLAAAKQFKKVEGRISLAALTPNVKQVFEISGFTSIFPIFTTREQAVQSFS